MREIKFRGKRKDNGEWVRGYYFSAKNKHYILPVGNAVFLGDVKEIKPSHKTIYGFYEVIPDTVAQYTGLDDKNDREIYGHHIIKVTEVYDDEIREHITDIEWTEASFVAKDCGKDYYRTWWTNILSVGIWQRQYIHH